MPGHTSHTRLSPISLIALLGTALVGFCNGDSRFILIAKSYETCNKQSNSTGAHAKALLPQ